MTTQNTDPKGTLYVVNEKGYYFRIEPDVVIDSALLESKGCFIFTDIRSMAEQVRRIVGLDAGTYDEIEGTTYTFLLRDGTVYEICDRGIASEVEGDVSRHLIDFEL